MSSLPSLFFTSSSFTRFLSALFFSNYFSSCPILSHPLCRLLLIISSLSSFASFSPLSSPLIDTSAFLPWSFILYIWILSFVYILLCFLLILFCCLLSLLFTDFFYYSQVGWRLKKYDSGWSFSFQPLLSFKFSLVTRLVHPSHPPRCVNFL